MLHSKYPFYEGMARRVLSIVLSIPQMSVPIVPALLAEAKQALAEIYAIEHQLLADRDRLLDRAWHLGRLLLQLKKQIGLGGWYVWLCAAYRTAG